jgi:hypothetical protein
MCQINTLRTFRWRHLLVKPERTYAYTWYNPECLVPTVNHGGLGSNIVAQYYVGPIITLHDRITARKYMDRLGNQVHPMIQTLCRNSDSAFQDGNVPIHTAGTVQSWFEEHEREIQHLSRPAQSQNLNILNHSGQFSRLE